MGMDRITAYISILFLVTEGDYTLKQDDFYGDLYVVKNLHQEEKSEEDMMNEMMVKEALTDDVSAVVDNVVSIKSNIEVEEFNK